MRGQPPPSVENIAPELQCKRSADAHAVHAQVDKVQASAVLSETAAKKEEFMASVQPGDVVNGNVHKLTDFGAFVALKSLDGQNHGVEVRPACPWTSCGWLALVGGICALAWGWLLTATCLAHEPVTQELRPGPAQPSPHLCRVWRTSLS